MRIAICDDDSAASNALSIRISHSSQKNSYIHHKSRNPFLSGHYPFGYFHPIPMSFLFAAETEHKSGIRRYRAGERVELIQLSNKLLRLHPDLQIIFFSDTMIISWTSIMWITYIF